MDAVNRTLGQAQIDEMLASQIAEDDPGRPKVKAVSASEVMRPSQAEPPPATSGDLFGGTMTRMSERLDALELTMKRAIQTEQAAGDVSGDIKQLRQGLQLLAKQTQTLAARMDEIAAGLEATPGYGLRKKFVCSTCKNKGFVATPARCTACGREILVGWPPQKRSKA